MVPPRFFSLSSVAANLKVRTNFHKEKIKCLDPTACLPFGYPFHFLAYGVVLE